MQDLQKELYNAVISRVRVPITFYYIASFCSLNWKPLFVVSVTKLTHTEKINYWNNYMEWRNYLLPALIALLLVWLIPWLQVFICKFTDSANSKLRDMKYKALKDDETKKLDLVTHRNKVLDERITEEDKKKRLEEAEQKQKEKDTSIIRDHSIEHTDEIVESVTKQLIDSLPNSFTASRLETDFANLFKDKEDLKSSNTKELQRKVLTNILDRSQLQTTALDQLEPIYSIRAGKNEW